MANRVVQQINAEMEELQKQLSQFKSSVEYLNSAKSNVSKAVDAVNKAEENFNHRVHELQATYDSFIKLSDAAGKVLEKIDTVNFPERLENIQSAVNDTIKNLNEIKESTISEVQKAANVITNADFDGRFSNLQNIIDASVKSNQLLAESIERIKIPQKLDEFEKSVNNRLSESFKETEINTKRIADDTSREIKNLNLPIRIDKLDANIAGISSAVQNIQGRLDLVENNIKDRIRAESEKQEKALNSLQEKLLAAEEKQISENNKRYKYVQIIGIITIILIVLSFSISYILKP